MKRPSIHLLTIVAAGLATAILAPTALHHLYAVAGNANNQINGAFRDGLFLARLDAGHGREPRLLSGRWSTDAHRRLFVTGYLQAYREMRGDPAPEQLSFSKPALKRGYRDGLADGLQRRYVLGTFQPTSTKNYRKADRGYSDSSGDLNRYKQAYREAYCNGYQLAYYGDYRKLQWLIS